jgi:hypothetical protein
MVNYSHFRSSELLQRDNGQIVTFFADGACPRLESITFKDFAVMSTVMFDLMERCPSLKIKWSRDYTIVDLTVAGKVAFLKELERFDHPMIFWDYRDP